MKTVSSALSQHIAGEVTTLATCWKLTRTDGVVMGFTDHDTDLLVSGVTYKAATGYTRSAIQSSASFAVDNLDIEGVLDDAEITEGDLRAGLYDHAEVEIFLVNRADLTQGVMKLRKGRVGEVQLRDNGYVAELRGLMQAFSRTIGELYSPDCRADLGDDRCKADLAAFTVSGTATTVTDRRIFTDSARTEPDGDFDGGMLTWTSGLNMGRKMEVKAFAAGGAITLFLPMPDDIAIGDAYDLHPGCDKTLATCRDRFANVLNFRGEPYVPAADAVGRIPDAR
jgi:uncharacterized phage protein (TIGR02218 family)